MASLEATEPGAINDFGTNEIIGWLNGSGGDTVRRLGSDEGSAVSIPEKQGVSGESIEPSRFCFRRFDLVERDVDPEVAEEQLKKDLAVLRGLQNQGIEFHPLAKGLHRIGNWLKSFQHRPSHTTAA